MKYVSTLRIKICACKHHHLLEKEHVKKYFTDERLHASSYLPRDEMGAECEGVTAGEGMWWLVPLSLVRTGDSVFTVLDADVADCKEGKRTN